MSYFKFTLAIFFVLGVSRFIPHPPNFTSLLSLSFYIPVVFGFKFIPVVVLSLFLTDLIIGFHSTMFFTIGSVIIIGLMTKYFNRSVFIRLLGALIGALLFYIITNFGVWTNGMYGYTFGGLIKCYTLAIPFFTHTVISTLLYSLLIEMVIFIFNKYKLLKKFN